MNREQMIQEAVDKEREAREEAERNQYLDREFLKDLLRDCEINQESPLVISVGDFRRLLRYVLSLPKSL